MPESLPPTRSQTPTEAPALSSAWGSPTALNSAFNDASADIVLVSNPEQERFRVHSSILKNVSKFFDSMMSLPPAKGEDGIIPMGESSEALRDLLDFICHWNLPMFPSFQSMLQLVTSLTKYEMTRPLHILGRLLPTMDEIDGLELYILGARMGSTHVLDVALPRVAEINVYTLHNERLILMLDSAHVWKIARLHRERQQALADFFQSVLANKHLPISCPSHWTSLGSVQMSNDTTLRCWADVFRRISTSMATDPSGKAILDPEFTAWTEVTALPLTYRCTMNGHEIRHEAIVEAIRYKITNLPTSVLPLDPTPSRKKGKKRRPII